MIKIHLSKSSNVLYATTGSLATAGCMFRRGDSSSFEKNNTANKLYPPNVGNLLFGAGVRRTPGVGGSPSHDPIDSPEGDGRVCTRVRHSPFWWVWGDKRTKSGAAPRFAGKRTVPYGNIPTERTFSLHEASSHGNILTETERQRVRR